MNWILDLENLKCKKHFSILIIRIIYGSSSLKRLHHENVAQ